MSIKGIFFALVAVNVAAMLIMGCNHLYVDSGRQLETRTDMEPTSFEFDDPQAAYLILEKLDLLEPLDYSPSKMEKFIEKTKKPFYGWIPDDDYCKKHREYFVSNPNFIFNEMNFLTSYKPESNLREIVIPELGRDMRPEFSHMLSPRKQILPLYEMTPDANMFFIFPQTYQDREIGRHFACTTQEFNHIPGHDSLYKKSYVSQNLVEYGENYESRPQCFDFNNLFLKTYVLKYEDQCNNFFKRFNSRKYQELKQERGVVYMRKIGSGVHQGKGVFPVTETDEQKIRTMYENGKLCGEIKENYIMQTFIHNPLLFDGRKGDLRVFLLVASTNPLIAFYHDGFFRISLHDYDVNSDEKGAYLTNLDLSEKFFEYARVNGTYKGMTEKELRDNALWNYDKLGKNLYDLGRTQDPNWSNNFLRPSFKKAMVHLLRAGQDSFLKRSTLFEIMALDFMLDEDLNLWFIEANTKPGLEGSSDEIKQLFVGLLKDTMDIVFGLLRSRTKRIINYVNRMTRDSKAKMISESEVQITDLPMRLREFREISKNSFEPEYEPRSTNNFTRIIDENLEGAERYFGLLSEECL